MKVHLYSLSVSCIRQYVSNTYVYKKRKPTHMVHTHIDNKSGKATGLCAAKGSQSRIWFVTKASGNIKFSKAPR